MSDLIHQITADLKTQIDSFKPEYEVRDVGAVIEDGDGIARVRGLADVHAQELVQFANGVKGIAFRPVCTGVSTSLRAITPGAIRSIGR